MLNARSHHGFTDLKSRVNLAEPPPDWAIDIYPDDGPALSGIILHALAGAIQVAAGLGMGWLIWGGA